MKFKLVVIQLKLGISYPYVETRNIWLHLVIFILIITNSFLAVGLLKYFSFRQNNKDTDRFANSYALNVSDRLLMGLDSFQKADRADFADPKIALSSQVLNDYLSKINTDLSAKVAIIDRNGSIIASNFEESPSESALSDQDILIHLQQKLSNLSALEQPRQLSLNVKQQDFLSQVIPWITQELGQDFLVIVTLPKSELLVYSPEEENNLSSRLAYLFSTIFLGLLTYGGTILAFQKLNQSKAAELIMPPKLLPPAKTTSKPIQLSDNQNDSQAKKQDRKTDNQPYTLLANMSHELRSPLNTILGFAQIIEQELSTTQASKENIAIINRSGEHLLSIINDVVDLSKIETNRLTLEHKKIDFYAWLDNIKQSFEFQAFNQSWEFSLVKQNNLPQYICIDDRRLRQILKNVIDYCLKSKSPEYITLKVTSKPHNSKVAQIKELDSNTKYDICFEVQNADFVASTTELATLFDPMVRVEHEQKYTESSSLNLPISRKLSQLMGGDLTVKSNGISNLGIIFNLEIQTESVVAKELQIEPTVRRIIGLESGQTEYRILVVDDSKTNRKIMSQLLETVGFQVQEAVNGKEAVDVWLHWQPHMIWMDLRMPVRNGCEATERIRSYSHNTRIPIVALSASTLEEEKSLFKAAGCDDFVGKPFSENIIFDKIAQHLGIRYVYEPIKSVDLNNFKLTADTLNVMPDEWLNRVEQAAIELNRDLLVQLLQEIPTEHADLKNALQKQINNFDFDRILSLAQKNNQN
ncbi:MAG: hybrid sensor histidine kinase/response regulator [Pleurocapsa sp.]